MSEGIDWPKSFPRTAPEDREPYGGGFQVTRSKAFQNILDELRVWCDECGLPVALSTNSDDDQPLRYECECVAVSPAGRIPDSWRNT